MVDLSHFYIFRRAMGKYLQEITLLRAIGQEKMSDKGFTLILL